MTVLVRDSVCPCDPIYAGFHRFPWSLLPVCRYKRSKLPVYHQKNEKLFSTLAWNFLVVAIVEFLFIGIIVIVIFVGYRNCRVYIYWLSQLSSLYLLVVAIINFIFIWIFMCTHTSCHCGIEEKWSFLQHGSGTRGNRENLMGTKTKGKRVISAGR